MSPGYVPEWQVARADPPMSEPKLGEHLLAARLLSTEARSRRHEPPGWWTTVFTTVVLATFLFFLLM